MFDYPKKAELNRIIPKAKIYAFAKPTRAVRNRFVSQVAEIVWKYKLSPETVNLPARQGIQEIQVFSIALKTGELAEDVLRAMDRAIPSPILFDLTFDGRVKSTAALKHRAGVDASKTVLDDYFETDWQPAGIARPPLPVALDLAGLYAEMLRSLLPVPPRAGEPIHGQVERARLIRMKENECRRLEARIRQEVQFNRKVEINAELRFRKAELPTSGPLIMDTLKLYTQDLAAENIEKIAAIFPNCITEARGEDGKLTRAVDFDQLRQELSTSIVEGPRERYHLDWPGKREALLAANAPIAKTLRPCREESVDFETTRNVFIEGDNLDALKLLQETYLNKVKVIYIDPPYNTGNDFIYDDDFSEDTETYFERSNQKDESGNRMVANTEANGRFHSDWLTMLYPRLRLAKNLLAPNGAIFVSIADHEIHNLRMIMNEVFGADNFVATIIWQKVFSPKNSARHFSEDHDYIVVYARNAEEWKPTLLPRTEEMDARYPNADSDPRGPWTSGDLSARNYYGDGTYPVTSPSGRVIDGPPPGRYWAVSPAKFKELDNDHRIWWGADGANAPRLKRFLSEVKAGRVLQTLWVHEEVGHTQEAKKELLAAVEFANSDSTFETPKPTRLLKRILWISTLPKERAVVLDFFAGSGSTFHAAMALNAEDSGNRQVILVQLPEPIVPPPPVGHTLQTIADIAKERIRRAGAKIKAETATTAPDLDVGFRVLKIDTSNMKDVYYAPDAIKQADLLAHLDNIREDRTAEDLLFQVLVDWGVDLTLPVATETIAGKTIFFVDGNALAACFDADITEDLIRVLAKRKPLRAVFRDSSYGTDSVKINVEQIFKLLSPGTEIKSL